MNKARLANIYMIMGLIGLFWHIKGGAGQLFDSYCWLGIAFGIILIFYPKQ